MSERRIDFKEICEKEVRKILFILMLTMAVMLSGCAAKPEIITNTEYKEVKVVVRCEASLPSKPKFDPAEPNSAKEIAKYYEVVEALLKECVGVRDE